MNILIGIANLQLRMNKFHDYFTSYKTIILFRYFYTIFLSQVYNTEINVSNTVLLNDLVKWTVLWQYIMCSNCFLLRIRQRVLVFIRLMIIWRGREPSCYTNTPGLCGIASESFDWRGKRVTFLKSHAISSLRNEIA